jgi:hypothetical protein
MPTFNYQSSPGHAGQDLWAKGHLVFARDGARFPPRCIVCNTADNLKWRKRTLRWVPPWLNYVLILGIIPGLILLFILQRKARINFATCARCRRRRLIHQLIAAGLILAFLACLALSLAQETPYIAVLGLGFVLVGALYATTAARAFTVLRISDHLAILRGLGAPFIVSLNQSLR